MVRHLRGAPKRPAVLEVGGDARRPKRVIADLGRDAGRPRPPLNHRIGVRLGQGSRRQRVRASADRPKQRSFRIAREPATARGLLVSAELPLTTLSAAADRGDVERNKSLHSHFRLTVIEFIRFARLTSRRV